MWLSYTLARVWSKCHDVFGCSLLILWQQRGSCQKMDRKLTGKLYTLYIYIHTHILCVFKKQMKRYKLWNMIWGKFQTECYQRRIQSNGNALDMKKNRIPLTASTKWWKIYRWGDTDAIWSLMAGQRTVEKTFV
jgi:hypothetical protein